MQEGFYIGLYWDQHTLTAQQYVSFAKDYLKKVEELDFRFDRCFSWGKSADAGRWLSDDFENFESIILLHIEDEDIKYINSDSGNWNITPEAKSPIGFLNTFTYYLNGEKQFSVSINAGSSDKEDTSCIIMKFESDTLLRDVKLLTSLLKLSISYIKPTYAILTSSEFIENLEDDNSNFDIGWLTYISDPEIAQYLPIDTTYEVLPHGGILIKLKEEISSADNQADVKAAIKIRDSLINNGISHWN